ncbi:MAG: hypothetical protein ATN36_08965 [Epulopiscium sp. Nele67-Bin005]|nr:MAG: hypothetical protein ATN36_08965 [Epulopiscium sp. Nele67-Bin005]
MEIKRHVSPREKFEFSIKGLQNQTMNVNRSFGDQLLKSKVLSSYVYKKSPKCIIEAQLSKDGKYQNFITGGWLEIFVKHNILQILKHAKITKYEIISNVDITLPSGEKTELDIVLHINQEIFWIECKTGGYQEYISKYNQFIKNYNLNSQNCFLVTVETEKENLRKLSGGSKMNVVSVLNFYEILENKILSLV